MVSPNRLALATFSQFCDILQLCLSPMLLKQSLLSSLLLIMKSLILRLSYQSLMGEVSCGSNKGKWSYLYAPPA